MAKTKFKTQVNKDISCDEYIGKPVRNGLGETIGSIIEAIDLGACIELTMEVDTPSPLAKPLCQSFELRGVNN